MVRSNAIGYAPPVKLARSSNVLVCTVCKPRIEYTPWEKGSADSRRADAVPKKRGPKTDVLDALLKRVDGLEAKLREKNSEQTSPTGDHGDPKMLENARQGTEEPAAKRLAADSNTSPSGGEGSNVSPPLAIPKYVPISKASVSPGPADKWQGQFPTASPP